MFAHVSHEHTSLIKSIIHITGCETYIELGVYTGTTIDAIRTLVKRAIGVDIKDRRINRIGEFYLNTTDNFFSWFCDKADVIFIDADHSFESAKKDLHNSLTVLNRHGIIIMHDTDPTSANLIDPGYCGDSYKIIDYINNNCQDLSVITLPVSSAGMSIIMRKQDRRIYDHIMQ